MLAKAMSIPIFAAVLPNSLANRRGAETTAGCEINFSASAGVIACFSTWFQHIAALRHSQELKQGVQPAGASKKHEVGKQECRRVQQ